MTQLKIFWDDFIKCMILAIEDGFTTWGLCHFLPVNGEIWYVHCVTDSNLVKPLEVKILDLRGECIPGASMAMGQVNSCLREIAPGLCFVDRESYPGKDGLRFCCLDKAKKDQKWEDSGHVHRINKSVRCCKAHAKLEIYP